MPQTNQTLDGTANEFKRDVRSELGWKLLRVVAYDGLAPSQIVRYLSSADRGLAADDFADLPFRIDATPDADNRDNAANVTTDTRRYVVDPLAERHEYDGLWTGGPAVQNEDHGHKIVQQTLTRTFPAGHGYTVDGNGRYVYSDEPDSREYATAADALKAHRPVVRRVFQSRMAFDPSIPGSFRTEVTWRDFTHESFPALEALTVNEVRDAIASHAGLGNVANAIAETHCAIDSQTNTVVFTAAGLYKESTAPTDVTSLLKAPRIEAPCTRETLRTFGLNELADGEGYRYTHTFRFLDLADTPAVRKFLEFGITDSAIIPKLVAAEYASDHPALDSTAADGKGRFHVTRGGVKQAWYRIALMRTDKQEEDGLLSFTIVLQKPEWHGKDKPNARRTMATQNPNGPGMAKETVIPSVPREAAEQVAADAQPDAGQTIVSASVTEGEAGSSDIRLHQAPEWKFDGTKDGPPPRVVSSLDGKDIPATSLRHTSTAMEDAWDAHFENLDPSRVTALISEVSAKLAPNGGAGRVVVKGISQTGPGTYTVDLHAEGVEKKVYDEWVATATHTSETSEQVKYNVPQNELTDGGLDEKTHVITRENRSLNRDGTWNEQITRVKPVACTLEYGSVSNHVTSHHTVYRNAKKLPAGLDPKHPTMQGSASHNEHGLVDAQTVEEDDDKVTQTNRGGDHFSATESVTKVQDAAPAETPGVSGGVITETQDVAYPDGKHRATVTKRTAVPCEHVVTKTKSGHALTVTHHRLTNGFAVPGSLQSPPDNMNVEGGAQHNSFGLVDAQWSEQERKDESQESKSKTYYGDRTDKVRVKDSGDGTAEQTSNSLKSYSRTTLPDGKVREQTSEETFTPRTETFYTQEGDRDHPRVVTHKVFRNQETLPEELNHSEKPGKDDLERFSGSADRNAHGTWDGHSQKYSVESEDDKSKSRSEDAWSIRDGDADIRLDSRMSEAEEFEEGKIVTVEETTFPSERISSRKTVETAKQDDWEFDADEFNPSTREKRSVHHHVYKNWQTEPKESVSGEDKLLSAQKEKNRFGLWDAHFVTGPAWKQVVQTGKHETHTETTTTKTSIYEKGDTLPKEVYEVGHRLELDKTTLEDGATLVRETETQSKKPHKYHFTQREKRGNDAYRDNEIWVFHNCKENEIPEPPTGAVRFSKACGDLELWSGSYTVLGDWHNGGVKIDFTNGEEKDHVECQLETAQYHDGESANRTTVDGVFWRIVAREVCEGVCEGDKRAVLKYNKSNKYPGGALERVSDGDGNARYWKWKTVRRMGMGTPGWRKDAMTPANIKNEQSAAIAALR